MSAIKINCARGYLARWFQEEGHNPSRSREKELERGRESETDNSVDTRATTRFFANVCKSHPTRKREYNSTRRTRLPSSITRWQRKGKPGSPPPPLPPFRGHDYGWISWSVHRSIRTMFIRGSANIDDIIEPRPLIDIVATWKWEKIVERNRNIRRNTVKYIYSK